MRTVIRFGDKEKQKCWTEDYFFILFGVRKLFNGLWKCSKMCNYTYSSNISALKLKFIVALQLYYGNRLGKT